MVKHIILWQLKDEYSEEEKKQIKAGIKEGLEGLMGKIPGKILQRARAHGIPVIAIAGSVEDVALLLEAGFAGVYATKPAGMPLEEAMKKEVARECVCQTVNSLFKQGLHGF